MGKKFLITCVMLIAMGMTSMAQKFALVDMEYILKNIPAYERANEQLNQTSKKWQTEVETLNNAAKAMYENYQNESVFLSAEQKKAKEQAILQKEKEASELKKKYFSPEGELYKKRESLIGWYHRIGSTGLYRPGKGRYNQHPSRCPHPKGICRRSSGRCPTTGLPRSTANSSTASISCSNNTFFSPSKRYSFI